MKKQKDNIFIRIYNGLLRENPTAVLCIGLCPSLAVSVTAKGALAMGIITAFVLILTETIASLLKKLIPEKGRLLMYLVLSACFTTIFKLFLNAFFPDISEMLGIFVALTAVNGIIFSRIDNYALDHNPVLSFFDAVGMGAGFTLVITVLGCIREILGLGTIFGFRVLFTQYTISITALAPGGFFILACIIAFANRINGGGKHE